MKKAHGLSDVQLMPTDHEKNRSKERFFVRNPG